MGSSRAYRISFERERKMNTVMSRVRRFLTSEDGPTSVEYALMVGLIAAALVTTVTSLKTAVAGVFSAVAGSL
jgi:pilus assembly protein Flp/PilA